MSSSRPNILLIMTDQQKVNSLSVYGNSVVQTPNLERLAARGVIFTHAFTPYPVCVPSRVMTFTGRYPHTNRSRTNSVLMQSDEEHLLKIFQREGYATALSGKNHCFQREDLERFDYVWECGHGGPQNPPDETAAAAKKFISEAKVGPRAWGTATNPHPPESLGTALTVTHAINFLNNRLSEQPFFLWCSIADPHTPLQTAEPYASMYDPSTIPIPEQRDNEMDNKPVAQQLDYLALSGDKVTEEDIRRVTALYYGMNTYIDHEVGRLLDHLDASGQCNNTLIIYMSDHGEYLGEHKMIRKSKALYDCLTHIPFIVSWPGHIPEGERRDEFIEVVDIAPTILDAIGIPHPDGIQGKSFLPLSTDDHYEPRDAVFAEQGVEDPSGSIEGNPIESLGRVPESPTSPDFSPSLKKGDRGPIKSIRTREWKCVYYPGNREGELYNLIHDPGELNNLWYEPEHTELKTKLTLRILDWCIETEDRRPKL